MELFARLLDLFVAPDALPVEVCNVDWDGEKKKRKEKPPNYVNLLYHLAENRKLQTFSVFLFERRQS